MLTVEQILDFAKRGWLELPPEPRYRPVGPYIAEQKPAISVGSFESFEDPETGEVLYKRKTN